MRKVLTLVALLCTTALALPLTGHASLASSAVRQARLPTSKVVYYCPELPPDCCRTGWSGHCVVCVQGGC